jgi:D-alanine-D-alanine ligase
MKIGLVFDLQDWYLARGYSLEETAEFDREDTIEGIEQALAALGHETERVGNAFQLVEALAAGKRWDLVFNIAEGLYGPGREALVPALLDAYQIPYTFSDPLVLALTLDKAACKRFVRDLGLPTPDFAVVREPCEIAAVNLPYPLFAKPCTEGTGKGISGASKITSPEALQAVCRDLLARFRQPVLVETYLPGREFTVGLAGTGSKARSLGCMEVVFLERAEGAGYTYLNKKDFESRVEYRPADGPEARAAEDLALAAWRGLHCRDAGRIDIRLDAAGNPSFIEVNPLAGINPVISDLVILCGQRNVSYQDLIAMILDSALERLGSTPCA